MLASRQVIGFLSAAMVTLSIPSKATVLTRYHATNRNYPGIKFIGPKQKTFPLIKQTGSQREQKHYVHLISTRFQPGGMPGNPLFTTDTPSIGVSLGIPHFSARDPPTALERTGEPLRSNSLLLALERHCHQKPPSSGSADGPDAGAHFQSPLPVQQAILLPFPAASDSFPLPFLNSTPGALGCGELFPPATAYKDTGAGGKVFPNKGSAIVAVLKWEG